MRVLLPSYILKLTCSRLWREILPCVSRLNRKAAETIAVHMKNVTSVFKTCPVPAVPIQKIQQHQRSEILLNCTLFQSIKCVKGEDEHVSFFYETCINVVLVILFTSSVLCKLIWVLISTDCMYTARYTNTKSEGFSLNFLHFYSRQLLIWSF